MQKSIITIITTILIATAHLITTILFATITTAHAGENTYDFGEEDNGEQPITREMYLQALEDLCPKVLGCTTNFDCEYKWTTCPNREILESILANRRIKH